MTSLRRLLLQGPAPWLAKGRAEILRRAGGDSKRIQEALRRCGVHVSPKTDRVAFDLGEMLEVFRFLKLSVDSLVSRHKKPTRRFARAILLQIRNDLYLDFDYHYKGLRRPLETLLDRLDYADQLRRKRRQR